MTSRAIVSSLLLLALVGCKGAGTDAGSGGAGSAVIPSGTFTSGAGLRLAYPVRVAPSADGTVYTSDAAGNAVIGLQAGVPAVAITGVPRPLGVAVAGSLLYVGSAGRQTVEVYDLAQQKGVRTLAGVEMPNAIAVAPDGRVYVADSKKGVVRVFDASGNALPAFGGTGTGPFLFPNAVAADATRVVVGDQGAHKVYVLDRAGKVQLSFGGEVTSASSLADYRGKFTSIGAVALASGRILVLDSAHSFVQAFDDQGTPIGIFGYAGDCATCTKLALDVAVDKDGNVLATDPEHHRVVSLSTELR